METVGDSYIARAAPHLHNADRESEAADCMEPRAELPLPVRTNHQAGMTGKETPMSQLYGDTTGHKESAKPAGQRWGEDDGEESSKTVSRLYEDTTNTNDSTSPVKAEDSGVYVYGGQNGGKNSPEASSRLYENSMVTGADYNETQSTMYEGGNPVIKHQTGSTANSIPGSTPQRAAGTYTNVPVPSQEETAPPGTHEPEGEVEGNQSSVVIKVMHNPTYRQDTPQGASDQGTTESELEHNYEDIDAPRKNVQKGNVASEEGTGATPIANRQDQTDWRSLADAAATIPNTMYVSRGDYMIGADTRVKKYIHLFKVSTLSDDVSKLAARNRMTELRVTELERMCLLPGPNHSPENGLLTSPTPPVAPGSSEKVTTEYAGAVGPSRPSGPPRKMGEKRPIGPPGPAGEKGPMGPGSPEGKAGKPGSTGALASPEPPGEKRPMVPAGPEGKAGKPGSTGLLGSPEPPEKKGPIGPTGRPGPSNSGFLIAEGKKGRVVLPPPRRMRDVVDDTTHPLFGGFVLGRNKNVS
ncbi:hypothetical protein Bbelb_377720 [Branchiostoma belcheri]|nr:hypothetical protein Bbelb_377720 [Branchiostoma belcheri]